MVDLEKEDLKLVSGYHSLFEEIFNVNQIMTKGDSVVAYADDTDMLASHNILINNNHFILLV